MKGATSYKQTSKGILPRAKVLTLEIEGTKKGLTYIRQQFTQTPHIAINSDFILALHRVSFGWIFPDWVGAYRKIQVTFSGKEAPPYYKVPELVHNLCEDLSERMKRLPEKDTEEYITEIVTLLAWFQHGFVSIHPFNDYNGRIARMLTIVILLNLTLPPIEIKAETGKDRKIYIQAMRDADNGNYATLERLIGAALIESMQKAGATKS